MSLHFVQRHKKERKLVTDREIKDYKQDVIDGINKETNTLITSQKEIKRVKDILKAIELAKKETQHDMFYFLEFETKYLLATLELSTNKDN